MSQVLFAMGRSLNYLPFFAQKTNDDSNNLGMCTMRAMLTVAHDTHCNLDNDSLQEAIKKCETGSLFVYQILETSNYLNRFKLTSKTSNYTAMISIFYLANKYRNKIIRVEKFQEIIDSFFNLPQDDLRLACYHNNNKTNRLKKEFIQARIGVLSEYIELQLPPRRKPKWDRS